jgi:hypothetical protein
MYQPYPSGSQMPEPQRAAPPPPVLMAVKLMYVGAGLSAIGIVLTLVTIGSLKAAILKKHPLYTTSQVHSFQTAAVASVVVGGLIAVGLWILMARANGAGKSWARIVASVLFGINTLDLLATAVQAHAAASLAFGALVWLAGLGAVVLLWRGESSQYFAAASGQGAPG